MKVIVAGTRHPVPAAIVWRGIDVAGFVVTEVVSGHATGVDVLGEVWAANAGVPVQLFPANWHAYGRAAGPIRNAAMAGYAEALIAFPKLSSRGTADMIEKALDRHFPIIVYTLNERGDEVIAVWKSWEPAYAP